MSKSVMGEFANGESPARTVKYVVGTAEEPSDSEMQVVKNNKESFVPEKGKELKK